MTLNPSTLNNGTLGDLKEHKDVVLSSNAQTDEKRFEEPSLEVGGSLAKVENGLSTSISSSASNLEGQQAPFFTKQNSCLSRFRELAQTYNIHEINLEEYVSQIKEVKQSLYSDDSVFNESKSSSPPDAHTDKYFTPCGSPTKLIHSTLLEERDTPSSLEHVSFYLQESAVSEVRFDKPSNNGPLGRSSLNLSSLSHELQTSQDSPSLSATNQLSSSDTLEPLQYPPSSFGSQRQFNASQDSPKRSPSKGSWSSILRRPSLTYSPKRQSTGLHRRSLTNYFKFPHRNAHQHNAIAHNPSVFGKPIGDLTSDPTNLCKFTFPTPECAPPSLLLPHIFAQCVHFLSLNALHVPGIFRISGSGPVIKAITEYFYSPPHFWLDETSEIFKRIGFPSYIDIAAVLKRYIMLLPGGLFTHKDILNLLVPLYVDSSRVKVPIDIRNEMAALCFSQIDSYVRFSILCSLLALLHQIATRTQELENGMENTKDSTLMKPEALGIIFGPLLLGNSSTDLSKSCPSGNVNDLMRFETEKARVEAKIVEGLIIHWPEVLLKINSLDIPNCFSDVGLTDQVAIFTPAVPKEDSPEQIPENVNASEESYPNVKHISKLPLINDSSDNESGNQENDDAVANESTKVVVDNQQPQPKISTVSDTAVPSMSFANNISSRSVISAATDSKPSTRTSPPFVNNTKPIVAKSPVTVTASSETNKKSQKINKKASPRVSLWTKLFGKFRSNKKKS
ncbi:Rho-type GTPase activating protein Rga6 [Schizosaccharomyces pombe]|uniref:Probable Rho-GTPase-activating protein 6 n=1 Tax=Schizosaccharomyces pombe (strain 972 / ATCC 24843) TaxID=284812 RepID=RGA6_SCHPO|nr:putative Rho-type GTPase-activating protein Rga6 [Schizosaccharomyces pombe]O43027.1 RecName: Full=Probable Rho-GTPase-activating protein 6 [Schizosaccharomyces pombe 972h-]CAA17813.1 Rho-type GTPase activating protein Rga6 (predicted) [Schizosaccharomyces pombe]|eukprot:NP_595237.1 putative Rho-type GTPase-activating protein Rga6 [Schizosaccharomyces pombe]